MNTQNRIDTIMQCLAALKRGVQQPTVIQEEDGSFDYIPGAYLSDASYTGSRTVVFTVDEQSFGSEFDLDAADDAELQNAAEMAAEEWDWTVDDEYDDA